MSYEIQLTLTCFSDGSAKDLFDRRCTSEEHQQSRGRPDTASTPDNLLLERQNHDDPRSPLMRSTRHHLCAGTYKNGLPTDQHWSTHHNFYFTPPIMRFTFAPLLLALLSGHALAAPAPRQSGGYLLRLFLYIC